MRKGSVLLAAVFAAALSIALSGQAPATGVTVFEGARFIVGDGRAPIENAFVVVSGARFTQAGRAADVRVPAGAMRVNLAGKTVMPAIIDTHTHLSQTREGLIDRCHPVRRRRPSGFRSSDPAARGEQSRQARHRLRANLKRRIGCVLTEAHRRADAEVRAPPEIVEQPFTRLAQMRMRVDDGRHHGLAGKVHAGRAGRHAYVRGTTDLHEAGAADHKRRVLDWGARVADDDPGALEDRDARRRLTQNGHGQRSSDGRNQQDCSLHGSSTARTVSDTIAAQAAPKELDHQPPWNHRVGDRGHFRQHRVDPLRPADGAWRDRDARGA